MYSTSNDYKNLIYTDAETTLDVYINNVLISADYILDCKIGQDILNGTLSLGSTTAKYVELLLYKDSITSVSSIKVDFGLKVNGSFETVPMGQFLLDGIEDNGDGTITIKGIDNMVKFNFNYDASNIVPCSLKTLLTNICSQAGVQFANTTFLNENVEINVYDNTLTAREYIGYIAEQAGCVAVIDRTGKLYFKDISGTQIVDLENFADYKFGEEHIISKVIYNDAIRDFEFGTTTNNTLWISEENVYIINETQVQNVFNKINGLTLHSFEGTTIIDPTIDFADIVVIDGKNVLFQGEMEFVGKFKVDIKSNIECKQKERTTVKTGEKAKYKRLSARLDQAEGTITLLSGQQEENTGKIAQIELDINSINLSVSEKATKAELQDDVSNLQNQIDGAIQFWNGDLVPTLSNYPANEWITEEAKNNHRADIYTVIEDVDGELKQGKGYRFDKVGVNWTWVELTDNELSAVQALANEAKQTANVALSNINNLEIGGTNLWQISDIDIGYFNTTCDGSFIGSEPHYYNKRYIPFNSGEKVVYQHWNPDLIDNNSNYNRIAWYDSSKLCIGNIILPKVNVANGTHIAQVYEAPANTSFMRIGCVYDNGNSSVKVKFEKGNKPTDWSPAPQDNDSILLDMSSDNKLTAIEKQTIKKEWDVIVSEKIKLTTEATNYEISTTNYDTAYNTLDSYLEPLLEDLTTTSDIVGSTLRNNFKNYYDSKTDLLNVITSTMNTKINSVETETEAKINITKNEVTTDVTSSVTGAIMTLLNNGYLTAEQVNALVEGNTEDIITIKNQLTQTITNSEMQIAITTALEGGISYFKNTLFTINENGMWIATSTDEFNAQYNNKGMYLYSYNQMIAKFDVNGAVMNNLKVEGILETPHSKRMAVTVSGENRVYDFWTD